MRNAECEISDQPLHTPQSEIRTTKVLNGTLRTWQRCVLLGLALGCGSVSCKGYFPLRRPSSSLWTPAPDAASPIQLPGTDVAGDSDHLQQDGVVVAVKVLDDEMSRQVFGVHLLRHRVQPLVVVVRNGSQDSYLFRKAGVGAPVIPAANAARVAVVHPIVRMTRTVKWLAWFVPGLVFETFVEPASTIDFPGVEEAAQRPPRVNTQHVIDEFVALEIPDAEIPPGRRLSGAMFIRPPKLGSVLPVTLLNARTQQPLVFDVPMPPAVYVEQHDYAYPYEQVWDGVVNATGNLTSWKVASADKEHGTLTVKAGVKMWPWRTARLLTITVEKVEVAEPSTRAKGLTGGASFGVIPSESSPATSLRTQTDVEGSRHDDSGATGTLVVLYTRVSLRHPLRASDTRSYGAHSVTVDRFFSELAGKFPSLQEEQEEDGGGESPAL